MSKLELEMLDKINFINKNKGIIKSSMMNKIEHNNETDSVIYIIILLLMDPKSLEDCEEFIILDDLIKDSQVDYELEGDLFDIFGTIRFFINKIYCGNIKGIKIMDRINEYKDMIFYLDTQKNNVMKKIIM